MSTSLKLLNFWKSSRCSWICDTPNKSILLGDFNLHLDQPDKSDTNRFCTALENSGLTQHVKDHTHTAGHILDLVISGVDDDLVHNVEVDPDALTIAGLTDYHYLIKCSLRCAKPKPLMITRTFREYGKIDHQRFHNLLSVNTESFPDCDDPDVLVQSFNAITSSVLNEVCPLITKTTAVKHRLPWYNDVIHNARSERRRLERRWKKSRSEVDEERLRLQKELVGKLITESKIRFFADKCISSNSKEMYRTINSLLNKPSKTLPDSDSKHDLANKFLTFFIEKVENIRNDVSSKDTSASASLSEYDTVSQCSLSDFQPLESEDIADIIRQFPSKSCSLDTIPSWLVKRNLDILLPPITKIVNASLSTGTFPSALKESIITPVIKKSNADRNSLKNYRPVANLPFLSKVIEKAASRQVMDHLDTNYLGEPLQSSYKRHHSTETALKVKNDLLCSLDNNKAVLRVLLDMSAAFDTVDHDILLDRLESKFGIKHMVKSWFSTYLRDRVTKVSIDGDFSDNHIMRYSLPQGSIIGPHGFILYTSPVGNIMRAFDISFHAYADDLQLYAEFDPRSEGDCERVLARLSSCIDVISEWMIQNTLRLNQDKTEFFLIANRNVSAALSDISLKLGELSIQRSTSIKNLGVTFDDSLTMYSQINTICKSVNCHIRNIWRIRRFITTEACHHIVRGLVLSRLDYANSLLFGAREADLTHLQRLQNKAARLVLSCGRDQSSTDLFRELHWLPVKQRIIYKLMLYIYKALNDMAPCYISAVVHLQNTDPAEYRQRLRSSSDQTRLIVSRSFKRAGDMSFTIAAAHLWNDLPVYLRESQSLPMFKRQLKTHLFP